MKRMKRLLCLLLCLLPLAALSEEDPVVVRVGKVEYCRSLAEYAMKSGEMMQVLGLEENQDKAALRDEALERLVNMGIVENKLMEAGKHDLTEDEKSMLRLYAGSIYDNLWQQFAAQIREAGYQAEDRQVTDWLRTELGCTVDTVYEEVLAREWTTRILDLYCSDITITTGEAVEFLEENYIRPDREAYEHDIPRYEEEVLSTGSEAFFVPEGYRTIRQILLPFPEELQKELDKLRQKDNELQVELYSRKNAIADAVLEKGDVDAAVDAYRETEKKERDVLEEMTRLQNRGPEELKATTEDIYRRLKTGESFLSVKEDYRREQDKEKDDLPFHPDSNSWPESVKKAAAALTSPGEVSQPVASEEGVHVIEYVGDIPGGIHQLSAEEKESLEATALQQKQLVRLAELMEQWRPEYRVETFPELLPVPES